MKKHLSQIWHKFKTSTRELFSQETVETFAESSKAVLEGAKTLEEQGKKLQQLKPILEQSSSLIEILCSPEIQLVGAALPFMPIAIALLKFYREKTHNEPTLEECVAIISQAAYLESFKEILSLPEYQDILANWNTQANTKSVTKQLKQLGEVELDAKAARRVIVAFPDSQLGQAFNQLLLAWLQQAGVSYNQAQVLTERVAHNIEPHFLQALAVSGDSVKQLAELYRNGGIEAIQQDVSIDQYLEEQIATKPEEKVFNESFSFKDIYVTPQARLVDRNGKIDTQTNPFNLETWAKSILLNNNPHIKRQVMFIQGGPGRGKSVFCRMFADWVRQYLHPMWTPILIRLRDIDEFQPSLEETLRSRVKADFAQSDDGWLTDAHTRFLFILDGFDELRIERSNNQSIERFLRQVGTFQNDAQESKAMGHQVLITGREMALHGIDRLPPNLARVEIAEMNADLQNQWFGNWHQQFPTDRTTTFKEFLQNDKCCPVPVKELAKEPLLLYMLVAMHRDDKLDISQFDQATGTTAKILVYEQALDWVLSRQRSDSRHPDLNYELTRQNSDALRRLLAEAAVCVVQSGGESASMQMVKARLQQDDELKELIARAEKELGEESLKTALGAFYIKSNNSSGVEFFHKIFQEFLCAEKLKQSLEEWTEPGKRGKTFNTDDKQLYEEIYDLLGYGGLTPEIVEYLISLLVNSKEFRPLQLFKRLENFYVRWCDGEFIDAPPENLPQKKMRQLREQRIQLGQRQVNVYTGLNVLILLLELHRYAQRQDELKQDINFYPSGQLDAKNRFTDTLLCIINYSNSIEIGKFNTVVGQFLSGANLARTNLSYTILIRANLSGADLSAANLTRTNLIHANLSHTNLKGTKLIRAYLSEANLSRANLSDADLIRANLIRANLKGANLNRANLSGANFISPDLSGADLRNVYLRSANLIRANLSDANLSGAILIRVNLSHTNLSGANLNSANFSRANLENITWDENTNWEDVQGLETANNVPESLKQLLGLN